MVCHMLQNVDKPEVCQQLFTFPYSSTDFSIIINLPIHIIIGLGFIIRTSVNST